MGFWRLCQERGAPPPDSSNSPGKKSHRVGGQWVPLTSPRLAHKGHNLARRQCEGEVFEHLEAGAGGIAVGGRGAKRPSVGPGADPLLL